MSDLESRLTEVLRAESEWAPQAVGLADAARSRARTKRRTRLAAVGGVGVAAVLVAVGITAFDLTDDPERPTPLVDTASDPDSVEAGRWESWHGVTVQVPDEWEYGDQATWCAGGGSAETFRVTRPGGVSEMIACTPASSYGLAFQEIDDSEPFDWPVVAQTGEAWPPGTYVGAHGENGVLVTVAGPDREDLLDVLATVQTVDDVDPNGCPARARGHVRPGKEMSVCRYDARGLLEQSERLDSAETEQAQRAVLEAPPLSAPNGACPEPPENSPAVALYWAGKSVDITLGSQCFPINDSLGDVADRELTRELLYWALSPGWSGPFYAGVPMPPDLRHRAD